jgi:hypothetical protein
MDDAAIHRVSGDVGGVVCSVGEGQWIATGCALAMTRVVWVAYCLSLRGGSGARDAAIRRISRNADGFVSSFSGSQWIATGFQRSR